MAERMASFCLATGMSPNEFKQLTQTETQAFLDALANQETD